MTNIDSVKAVAKHERDFNIAEHKKLSIGAGSQCWELLFLLAVATGMFFDTFRDKTKIV